MENIIEQKPELKQEISWGGGRQSNIELLRVVAMLMIIMSHVQYAIYGYDSSNYNKIFLSFFVSMGQIGVILFILISGYFLCVKKFNVKNYLRLYLECVFYGLILYFIGYNLKYTYVGFVVEVFFPITSSQYWFLALYFVFYLLSPFINFVINKINKNTHLLLMSLIFIFTVILPSLKFSIYGQTPLFLWWLGLYLIGAYIRLYPKDFSSKKLAVFMLIFTFAILIFGRVLAFNKHSNLNENYYCERINIVVVLFALSLFNLFRLSNIKQSKLINLLGGATFGVYIIHNSVYFQWYMWKRIFHIPDFLQSKYLWLVCVGSVFAIFIVGSIIDILRQKCIEKPLFKLLDKICGKAFDKVNNMFNFAVVEEYQKEDEKTSLLQLRLFMLVVFITMVTIFKALTDINGFYGLVLFILLYFSFEILLYIVRRKRNKKTS